MRGRFGNAAGNERACHRVRETNAFQRVPLLKLGAGRHGCFQAGTEVAIHRPHFARCALEAGGDR
ncbi:hypothetical protein SGPA1_40868 [Streptomyces misionensis JCM 4497]